MTVLIINRNPLDWTAGVAAGRLPVGPRERVLLTRKFGHGLRSWSSEEFPDVTVTDMTRPDQLEAIAEWLVRTRQVSHVLALHEKDQLLSARLRRFGGMTGPTEKQVLPFRDKLLMKQCLTSHGYFSVPRYTSADGVTCLDEVSWTSPSVLKSRWGLGSSEVVVVSDDREYADALQRLGGEPGRLELEEFIDGPMFHVDSVVSHGGIRFAAASQYLHLPAEFEKHSYQANFNLPPSSLRDDLLLHNQRVLSALGLFNCVTHVEFFLGPAGITFCEAAARPGGSAIDMMVNQAFNVDLIRAAVQLQCGVEPELDPIDPGPEVHGVVGIYRNRIGRDVGTLFNELGESLVEYRHMPHTMGGPVRHATDFDHRLLLRAADLDQFHSLLKEFASILGRVLAN